MEQEVEFSGFVVEKVTTEINTLYDVKYILHGKRGGTIRLVRKFGSDHLLYALNSNWNVTSIKGNYTFSDKSGKIEYYNSILGD